jgi:hypothetical protein
LVGPGMNRLLRVLDIVSFLEFERPPGGDARQDNAFTYFLL